MVMSRQQNGQDHNIMTDKKYFFDNVKSSNIREWK